MSRPILNYSTSISVDKTVAEIQKALSQCRDIQVLTAYEGGIVSSISFRLTTQHGVLSFLLPAKIDSIWQIMKQSKNRRTKRTRKQAAMVAWRIIKDWIEAQVALIQADQVTLEEAFLPFIQDEHGQTLYAALESKGFKGLALPAPKG